MFIKFEEAVKLLGVSKYVFRGWVRKGLVPVRRIGTSQYIFHRQKLLDWWKSVEHVPNIKKRNILEEITNA
ncbi:MAG: helix-turn-helix domain-containing protein [Pseudomonadota bacterium]|jgi:excisionase family DNA binding protein